MAVEIVDVMQAEAKENKKVDNSKNEIFFRLHKDFLSFREIIYKIYLIID